MSLHRFCRHCLPAPFLLIRRPPDNIFRTPLVSRVILRHSKPVNLNSLELHSHPSLDGISPSFRAPSQLALRIYLGPAYQPGTPTPTNARWFVQRDKHCGKTLHSIDSSGKNGGKKDGGNMNIFCLVSLDRVVKIIYIPHACGSGGEFMDGGCRQR